MNHEIKISLTLTLEGEASQSNGDVRNFINDLMLNVIGTKTFSLQGYEVNRIMQEAEIYGPDQSYLNGAWEFVEKFYPNHYSCAEITRNDDLCKIVNDELNGTAEELFENEFNEDRELATIAFDHSTKYIYERAIMGYLHSLKETISISWSILDVEERAAQNGYLLKDGQALAVLKMLRDRHDCNFGVSWDTIDDYLSSIVPDLVYIIVGFLIRHYKSIDLLQGARLPF